MQETVLKLKNYSVSFDTPDGEVQAVRNVDLTVKKGEILCIVGESGCGKTVMCRSVMKLLPPNAHVKSGEISLCGENITAYKRKKMEKLCGSKVSMVFQDPMTSLNPTLTVGDQIGEVIKFHEMGLNHKQIDDKVCQILEMVGIPAGRRDEYPHQFSGGMKQRVVIAIALACKPQLLLADEPTTALDVTIQAQVLALMKELKKKFNTAMLLITHDLGIVAQICDKVGIMYAGEIIEFGTVEQIFNHERHHPYTEGLFGAIPNLRKKEKRLHSIEGMMPDPAELPAGCKFHTRCPYCTERCTVEHPEGVEHNGHIVACFRYEQTEEGSD